MENSLILAHLPYNVSHHRAFSFIKERATPPEPRELADALVRHGMEKRRIWELLHNAGRSAEATFKAMLGSKMHAASYWENHYPSALRALQHPPWNLFYVGDLPRTDVATLAIVGTRRPDEYGINVVANFLPSLQIRPLQIVSGLAHGVDSLAHHHACECSIPNFAVLGSGADVLYPKENASLAARILKAGGGILSEFAPGTPPLRANFPQRNRIISGLAHVVWIVQGTSKSGSLHTVEHALDQAKLIVASPGSVFNELSEVPNRLIYDGAQAILRPTDLDQLLARPSTGLAH